MVLKAVGILALQKYSDRVKVHHAVQLINKRREKILGILVRSDCAGHAHQRFVPRRQCWRCQKF
jgi:hypothetical protein